MASLPLPACDTTALWMHLHDRYNIEIPVVRWNDLTMVRLSVQAYNTSEDVEALVRAIHEFYA
jgi:isopenicillin-N epimerase